ncbi:membrane integrity-associated transporter subunit PqiC [Aquincola sp. J276]|uniref:PqiC family protein n=1 Tax=Aquincola sp. J276 TaxID=2898432 RepID=UPI002151F814|nr:PqiC family protein [Aquincola sp. J276]MCR5863732.1 PqiC family protein [Aquincola sp. J276]
MKPLRATLLSAAVLLSACASSPPPAWHSLLPEAASAAAATALPAAAAGPSISVGRISVPEAVDRSPLVVAQGSGLAVLDGQRWVEPVKAQLPRAMALLLAERLPGATVTAWPAAGVAQPDWRLSADVQRFDLAGTPARAQLRVVWTLRAAGTEAAPPPRVFDTTVAAEGGSEAALVAAMRTAVARWADAVAQAAGGTAAAAGR